MGFMTLYTYCEPFVSWVNAAGESHVTRVADLSRWGATLPTNNPVGYLTRVLEDLHGRWVDGKPNVTQVQLYRDQWFARYSANGYLDATDWVGPCCSEEQAKQQCQEMYGEVE